MRRGNDVKRSRGNEVTMQHGVAANMQLPREVSKYGRKEGGNEVNMSKGRDVKS